MDTIILINEQINSCRQLLQVFKDERESFSSNGDINLSYVMKSLERKKEILKSFETQKQIMNSVNQNLLGEVQEKALLRELSSLLEQLLVIDQENEIMLRDLLSHKPRKKESIHNVNGKNPHYRPQLPFCPKQNNSQEQSPEVISNTTIADKSKLFSRNRLKAYGI